MRHALNNSFTDPRDGQIYPTVKIGNQVWLAENLRYSCADSYAYDNDEENVKTYGRLYTYKAALIACPAGWHLPSDEDWQTLIDFAGGKTAVTKLKSKSGWDYSGNGTDDYGFSALPGGRRYSDGLFYNAGNNGYWWSATEHDADGAWYRDTHFNFNYNGAYELWDYKNTGFSVRCVKD